MTSLLEADSLVRTFHRGNEVVRAVNGISLQLQEHELVALTGPSGSGKSTLLHLLAGLLTPHAGRVDARRPVLVFQAAHLVPWLTVQENLDLAAALSRTPVDAERRRNTVQALGLTALLQRRVPTLSRGECQRVAIARAMETAPGTLLLDEPTAHLDASAGQSLMTSLRELTRNEPLAVLLATHDPDLLEHCDRVIALE